MHNLPSFSTFLQSIIDQLPGFIGGALLALLGVLLACLNGRRKKPGSPKAGSTDKRPVHRPVMTRYDKALRILAEPENEPLRWLLGEVLERHAKLPFSHFLLDSLEEPRGPLLASWNYWI